MAKEAKKDQEPEVNQGEGQEQTAPPAPPVVSALPPGVFQADLSEKDMEKLGQLDAVEKKFNEGCGALVRGFAKLLGESGQIEQAKAQLANELKIKHDLADDTVWQADFNTGKLYYRLAPKQEVPPVAG